MTALVAELPIMDEFWLGEYMSSEMLKLGLPC